MPNTLPPPRRASPSHGRAHGPPTWVWMNSPSVGSRVKRWTPWPKVSTRSVALPTAAPASAPPRDPAHGTRQDSPPIHAVPCRDDVPTGAEDVRHPTRDQGAKRIPVRQASDEGRLVRSIFLTLGWSPTPRASRRQRRWCRWRRCSRCWRSHQAGRTPRRTCLWVGQIGQRRHIRILRPTGLVRLDDDGLFTLFRHQHGAGMGLLLKQEETRLNPALPHQPNPSHLGILP
jgi:hypothetical protein